MAKRQQVFKKRIHHNKIDQLIELNNNIISITEGPRMKKWSIHDMIRIQPMTENQENVFNAYRDGQHICMSGSAGTGKTFLSLYLAFEELLSKDPMYTKIIIVRSTVATRDMGFMPGDLDEKISLYELPYKDSLQQLFKGRGSTYDDMKKAGILQFVSTSYIRGLTWDNTCVIVDEAQNMTFHELNSIITRIGENSRIIINGDVRQNDLKETGKERSGLSKCVDILKQLQVFTEVTFTHDDIVRSKFVKDWIIMTDKLGY